MGLCNQWVAAADLSYCLSSSLVFLRSSFRRACSASDLLLVLLERVLIAYFG